MRLTISSRSGALIKLLMRPSASTSSPAKGSRMWSFTRVKGSSAEDPFTRVKDHILLPFAGELVEADGRMSSLISAPLLEEIVSLIPEAWLGDAAFATHAENRAAYTKYLRCRLTQPHA